MTDKLVRRTETAEGIPLKPCPFCGGEARIFHFSSAIRDEVWRAVCDKPFCAQGPDGYTEAEAITAWNTRYQYGLTDEDYNILLDELGVSERMCRNTQSDFDFMCSECGKCVDNGRLIGINYCPNCGAKVVDE